jgi:hypothetical protein
VGGKKLQNIEINKELVPVDLHDMTVKISTKVNAIYIVCNGEVKKYPAPKYGNMEIGFNNYKPGHPAYRIVAD